MKIWYFKSPTFRGWDFFQHPRAIAISWLEDEGVIGLDRPGGGFKRWNPPGVAGKGKFLDFPLSWTPVYVFFPFRRAWYWGRSPKTQHASTFGFHATSLVEGLRTWRCMCPLLTSWIRFPVKGIPGLIGLKQCLPTVRTKQSWLEDEGVLFDRTAGS